MFFLLCSLLSHAEEPSEPSHQMEIEVIGKQYKEIYVAPPVVKQDGKEITDYDYAPVVFSKMVLYHKSANYYYNAKIEGIFNTNTISVIADTCSYETTPYKCSSENNHWVLRTDIQITAQKAYISMVLFDENMMPAASATVSKKLRRQIIPTRQQTSKSSTNGSVQGVNVNQESTIEERPIILDFPAIIDSGDVSQVVQLLYSNLK